MQDVERAVQQAVDRLVQGIENALAVGGRLDLIERDLTNHEDGIKYLRGALHDVRNGSATTPGLTQLTMGNRELTLELGRLKENDVTITKTLEGLVTKVADLQSDGKLLAWKIGAIIGVLVFIASRVADQIHF